MDGGFEILLPGEVLAALERGATVVTGNQRAARTLRQGFDVSIERGGLRSWEPARVLAWDAWTSAWWGRLVMEGRVTQMLLNRSQELSVWRTVLDADEELEGRQKDSLVEVAADAWGCSRATTGWEYCGERR